MEIKNIYCIGRNYAKHAYELGNEIPEQMILFSKPTHAIAEANGQPIILPKDQGEIHHELEIVLRINKQVKKGDRVEDVVSEMALGLDLTLRDVQSTLKKQGRPWLRAKGFKNSAVIGEFWSFPGTEACKETSFSFKKNNEVVQIGKIENMLFPFQAIIDECSEHFGLSEGDLIFTGTPEGVGPLMIGDECSLYWGDKEKGSFIVG